MDTVKIHEVSQDALFLRAFSFSLRDRAKNWFKAIPQGSITTWDELAKAFLNKYFPPRKTAEMRNQILSFKMKDDESLYEGWERFKELLMLCPHHGQEKWTLLHVFYNAVDSSTRLIIDASAGGRIMAMEVDEAWDLIETTAQHSHSYSDARSTSKKAAGMYEVQSDTLQQAQMDAMSQEIKRLKLLVQKSQGQQVGSSTQAVSVSCQFCGEGDHTISSCQLYIAQDDAQGEANYTGNFNRGPRNDPYSNTYNPGWRNHPNFSYANNQAALRPPPGFQQRAPPPQNQERAQTSDDSKLDLIMKELQNVNKILKNHDSLHAQYALNAPRPQGQLPGQTEANPKGQINAVTLRSGKQLEDPKVVDLKQKGKVVEEPEEVVIQEKEQEEVPKYVPPPPFKPPLPFPQRRAQAHLDQQFGKFVEVLKKLYINIPFTDALKQMPTYVKFLKEILSNKRKIDEYQSVSLSQECNALIQNKLPPKLEDPGSFSVPMVIGKCTYHALCDLGASVSIIPLSICKKLDLGESRLVDDSLHAQYALNAPRPEGQLPGKPRLILRGKSMP